MSDLIELLKHADDEEEVWLMRPALIAEIERLQAAVDAGKEMASDYERYEPRGDNWLDYPLHDVDILAKWKARIAALDAVEQNDE